MISIPKRFLFIHVPKTGGNSIFQVLREYSDERIITPGPVQDGIERFGTVNDAYPTIVKHSSLGEHQSALPPDVFRSLYKFAILRNPWERMISWFFSPHRQLPQKNRRLWQGAGDWNRDKFLGFLSRRQGTRHYTCLPDSPTLSHDLDFLMRFEHLDEHFAEVCRRLEIPARPLPKYNRSTREHYSHYYDDELEALVGDMFREEIEFAGYRFERIESSAPARAEPVRTR
jgi:hypothetical protein